MTNDGDTQPSMLCCSNKISSLCLRVSVVKSLTRRILVVMSIALTGCGPKQQPDKNAAQAHGGPRGGAYMGVEQRDSRPVAEIVRERLTGSNNGLEVRHWTVLDSSERVMNVLSQHADGAAADPASIGRLKRNGLRFVRVPADQVDKIVSELGGALTDRNEWNGQVYEWRALDERPIDNRGTAIAIDGRVRRFDRGDFRLLLRSWTVMMEDNPYMHVEMLPQHRLPQSNNLRLLLGQKPEDAGEAFASLALDLQLQAGYAYVLVSESPSVDWPALDKPAADQPSAVGDQQAAAGEGESSKSGVDQAAKSAAVAAKPPAVRPRGGVGPDEAIGPEAGAPRTLGEVLLPLSVSPPTRELLVFVPRIPQELFPPVYESDLSARRPAKDKGAEPSHAQ